MISKFDLENLREVLKDFYTIVRLKISIFDDEFNLIVEYPDEASPFCQALRNTDKGLKACHKCDIDACKRAKKLRKPHIYTCHAGITEAITPIQIGNGVVGYAILAQMLPIDTFEEDKEDAIQKAMKYGVDEATLRTAIVSMKKRTYEQINAAVKVLDALSTYVYIHNLVYWKNDDLSSQIDQYILSHINMQLTSQMICSQFHCSRSYLYKLSNQAFGMGIGQYIDYIKIENAKKMLLNGDSLKEISIRLGYDDYNYFCKVFKKKVGISPTSFRKKQEQPK